MPILKALADAIDTANDWIGRIVSWVALVMVLAQFVIVVMRYVFGIGSTIMQESIIYMHAVLFMVAAGYTLLYDGHVRVDIFYAEATRRRQAWTNLLGVIVFLLPVCTLVWWVAWPYVSGAWAVLEGSPEGRSGIPAVFLLKSVILVFATVVSVQGISMALKSLLLIAGIEAGGFAKDKDEEGFPV